MSTEYEVILLTSEGRKVRRDRNCVGIKVKTKYLGSVHFEIDWTTIF
jgi:hypothetical protein